MEQTAWKYETNMSVMNTTLVIAKDAEGSKTGGELNKITPVLLVMVSTLIGNLVLIFSIVCKRTRRRKRVNVFLVNLAVADLTVACITMTTELLEAVFKQWVLGAFLCKLLLYLQVVTLSSTTFLLTGMSVDRYQVIARPLHSLAHRPRIKCKVVGAWIMAFVISIPQILIFVEVEQENGRNHRHYYCKSAGYSAEWQRKFYFTFLTFYILLLPAGIMLFCYSNIVKVIWRRCEKDTGPHMRGSRGNIPELSSTRTSLTNNVISASKRKVVFMTLSVIIAYIVCLTPYFIICLIRIYSHYELDLTNELTTSQTIFMLHSALNPVLYGIFTLRTAHLRSLYSAVFCRHQDRKLSDNNKRRHIIRKPHFEKLRAKAILFRRDNNGETSVIIANHAAKEETTFRLRAYR